MTDARSGLLVDPDDEEGFGAAIWRILVNSEMASRSGSVGPEDARRRFDLDLIADQWLDWYAELHNQASAQRLQPGQEALRATTAR